MIGLLLYNGNYSVQKVAQKGGKNENSVIVQLKKT